MPLFYVIAGFFSRLVLQKSGTLNFIKKRWERIGVPFIVSIFTILPFSIFPFLFNYHRELHPGNLEITLQESLRSLISWNGLAHLWFLYYLLIYYVFIIITRKWSLLQIVSKRISHTLFLFLMIFFSWVILLMEQELYIQVDTGFLPEIRYILYYLLFFISGYFIHSRPLLFEQMKTKAFLLLIISVGLFLFLFYVEIFQSSWYVSGWMRFLIKLLTAIQVVLLIAGIIGFFLRVYSAENAIWKYISDASYWMYLIHLGIVAGMQVFLSYSSFPGLLRFPLILIVTLFLSLITYHFFVRYTFIGKHLHGVRVK